LPTAIAAKVERFSTAFSVESGCFVHGHPADGVFRHRFLFYHGHDPFIVVVVILFPRFHVVSFESAIAVSVLQ
jgi:hypothetical protein